MGKNRKSNTTNGGKGSSEIDNMTTPDNPSQRIIDGMSMWQSGVIGKPELALNDDEIDYILHHMKYSDFDEEIPTGQLTRVEKAYHFLDGDYKVGDVLDTESLFRAFSREPDSTAKYLRDHYFSGQSLVIYRTNGHVPHYNVTRHTHEFPDEKESWVETGKLKVDNIARYTADNSDVMEQLKKGLYLENYPSQIERFDEEIRATMFTPPSELIFVDLSPV